jgi:two-component system chemotaxis response regulator CheY
MLNKQINDILDTVDLAFLYFNKDLKINKNFSEILGYDVITQAENGYGIIEKFKIYKLDIITMDITMPIVNRIKNKVKALKEIMEINNNASVIMLTSHSKQKLVVDIVANSIKNYILKSITKEKIEDIFSKIKL